MEHTLIPSNVDPLEVEKFARMAPQWWDPDGVCRPLHDLNPVRLAFIQQHSPLAGKQVLDVGCGGGLLSEAMAHADAHVTGIDLNKAGIQVAQLHAMEHAQGLNIDYRLCSTHSMAAEHGARFDVVSCLELLEHVPDPADQVRQCAALCKPGGTVFFSTINRTPLAYAAGIVGAEYLLKLLPKGTHDYQRLIQPAELDRWARQAGLLHVQYKGLAYLPMLRRAWLSDSLAINYIACFRKDS